MRSRTWRVRPEVASAVPGQSDWPWPDGGIALVVLTARRSREQRYSQGKEHHDLSFPCHR